MSSIEKIFCLLSCKHCSMCIFVIKISLSKGENLLNIIILLRFFFSLLSFFFIAFLIFLTRALPKLIEEIEDIILKISSNSLKLRKQENKLIPCYCFMRTTFQWVTHAWNLCCPMMFKYDMDTIRTCHVYDKDTNFIHKKWSVRYNTAWYVAHLNYGLVAGSSLY